MYDVMQDKTLRIDVLDKGYVRLVEVMPRMVPDEYTADYVVVEAARTSTNAGLKTPEQDKKLLRYLFSSKHTSCFEMAEVKLEIKLPLFVFAQHVRHRTFSTNSLSARYSVMPEEYYIPDAKNVRAQSKVNKQGGAEEVDSEIAENFIKHVQSIARNEHSYYTTMTNLGISKELARINLPQNLYTRIFAKVDLNNLFKYLTLRMDSHAQYEIRVYAQAMYDILKPIFPWSFEAFDDYVLNSITLSALELRALKTGDTSGMTEREISAFLEKSKHLCKDS